MPTTGTMLQSEKDSYDALAAKLTLAPLSMGTITTGTAQPISFTDALFAGKVAGGRASGTGGTIGIVSTSFASDAAEQSTGSNQGGLSSAAASDQPYNSTDFVGGRFHCDLVKSNGEPLVLADVLTTAAAGFPLSVAAPVRLYLAYRPDKGANLKWRGWFYFTNQATGNRTPVTPDISVATVSLTVPQVTLTSLMPTAAAYSPIFAAGSAEIEIGGTASIADLGTKAGGSSGLVADAAHVHAIGTATPLVAALAAAVGTGTKPSREDHVHPLATKDVVPATYSSPLSTPVAQTAGAATAVLKNVALSDNTAYTFEAVVFIRGTGALFALYQLSQTWYRAAAGVATLLKGTGTGEQGPPNIDEITDCVGATLVANSNGVDLKCGPSATQNCNVDWQLTVTARPLVHA